MAGVEIEAHDSAGPIAAEWSALVDRTGAPPWLRPGWIDSWMQAHATGALHVLAARRDGRVVAVVPLNLRKGSATSTAVWQSLVAEDDEARAGLLRALFGRGGRRVTLLCGFVGLAPVEACSAAAEAAGWRTVVRPYLRSPYVTIAGGWDEYLESRQRKYLKEILRRRRRLGEEAELTFELLRGDEDLERLLDEGFRLEGSGWKVRDGTAVLSSPALTAYYRNLGRWAAAEGMLRLAFLRLGGRGIAFDFLIEDGGRLYNLKGGYDETYARFGPGVMLVHDCIAYCFERRLRSYELLGDVEPWKLEWANGMHERTILRAFGRSAAARLDYLAFAHGRRAARRAVGLLRR